MELHRYLRPHRHWLIPLLLSWIILLAGLLATRLLFGSELGVPPFLSYQGRLTDGGGNPLPSGLVSMQLRVTDGGAGILFAEEQEVTIVDGVASVIIGQGVDPETGQLHGGLPPDIFHPGTPHFLEIWINGALADDPLEIVAVPYAYWSAQALHVAPQSIDSTALAEGVVTLPHLASGFVDELALTLTSNPIFRASMADQEVAGAIGVQSTLNYSTATTIQAALEDLDRAIRAREEKNVDRDGDTMHGRLDITAGGLGVRGEIAVEGDVVVSGTVDGIDIAAHRTAFDGHAAATAAHGAEGPVVGQTTLDQAIAARQGALTAHSSASTAHGAQGAIVGTATLDAAIAAQTTALTGHTAATAAHGSDGSVVGARTLVQHTDDRTAHGARGAIVGETTLNAALQQQAAQTTSHANAAIAHGANGPVVGINTLDAAIQQRSAALSQHTNGKTVHGSDGPVVGLNTLNQRITPLPTKAYVDTAVSTAQSNVAAQIPTMVSGRVTPQPKAFAYVDTPAGRRVDQCHWTFGLAGDGRTYEPFRDLVGLHINADAPGDATRIGFSCYFCTKDCAVYHFLIPCTISYLIMCGG
jgi:hypothetical protein